LGRFHTPPPPPPPPPPSQFPTTPSAPWMSYSRFLFLFFFAVMVLQDMNMASLPASPYGSCARSPTPCLATLGGLSVKACSPLFKEMACLAVAVRVSQSVLLLVFFFSFLKRECHSLRPGGQSRSSPHHFVLFFLIPRPQIYLRFVVLRHSPAVIAVNLSGCFCRFLGNGQQSVNFPLAFPQCKSDISRIHRVFSLDVHFFWFGVFPFQPHLFPPPPPPPQAPLAGG